MGLLNIDLFYALPSSLLPDFKQFFLCVIEVHQNLEMSKCHMSNHVRSVWVCNQFPDQTHSDEYYHVHVSKHGNANINTSGILHVGPSFYGRVNWMVDHLTTSVASRASHKLYACCQNITLLYHDFIYFHLLKD